MNDNIELSNEAYTKRRPDLLALSERLLALAVLIFMLLALAQTAVLNGAAQTIEERILTLALGEPIDSPNPFVGITESAYIFYGLVYDYLMTPDENMINRPNLALSWFPLDGETAAASGTTFQKGSDFPLYYNTTDWPYGSIWQYNLSEAYWSDGVQFTADDVEWTLEIQIGSSFMTY